MAWFEVHQSLMRHPKLLHLEELTGTPRITLIGHLVSLWSWALDASQDGGPFKPRDLRAGAEWPGDSQLWTDALITARWIDQNSDGLYIHNWDDYQGRLLAQRAANRDRVRRSRARNAHVTRTSPLRNGATQPNQTVPNQETPPVSPLIAPLSGGHSQDETPEPQSSEPEPQPDGNSQSNPKPKAARTIARAAPTLTSQQRAKLVEKWSGVLGDVGDRIDAALAHKSALQWTDMYLHANNWLQRDADKLALRRAPAAVRSGAAQLLPNGHGPPQTGEFTSEDEQARAEQQERMEIWRARAKRQTG